MALKPGTIKALFGKLAGQYGDDVIEGVAKYGDDVVGAAAPYVDDVAEDTTRLLNYYNNNTKWSRHPALYGRYVDNPVLQNALQSSTYYIDDIPVVTKADSGVLKKAYDYVGANSQNISDERWSNLVDAFSFAEDAADTYRPSKINFLGDASWANGGFPDFKKAIPGANSIDVPGLNLRDLVEDWQETPEYLNGIIRPHNNTALGRWYRKQMSKKV